jgi:magnesium transporter
MFSAYNRESRRLHPHTNTPDPAVLDGAVWIDLLEPTADEVTQVERATGLEILSRAEIDEIENSSRVSSHNGSLYLTMPLVSVSDGAPRSVSAGFILSPDRLITIRFEPSRIFDAFAEALARHQIPVQESSHFFVGIVEAVVDRQADVLEGVRGELEELSHRIFGMGMHPKGRRKVEDRALRATLGGLGRLGDVISHVRETQVGAGRIVPFVQHMAEWLPVDLRERLETLRQDIASVSDFDTHLNDKLQFILDATLGFINMAQNDVMKVLTIASVAGIPPVLIAGIYGMNFKAMPELNWALGYPYALALIVITTVIPLIVFKVRGWF